MKKDIIVNKLILVGNGLDLALGLKTDYESFIVWYFKDCFLKALKSGDYNLPVGRRVQGHYNDTLFQFIYPLIYRNFNYNEEIEKIEDIKSVQIFLMHPSLSLQHSYNSELFVRIYKSLDIGWVDIEGIYYNLLKESIKSKSTVDIEKLNVELEYLKNKLEEYLISINSNEIDFKKDNHNFVNQFFEPITTEELLNVKSDDFITIQNTYFLNFNYTYALSKLLKSVVFKNKPTYEVNHIHGELESDSYPIIFGFGDEMDGDYKKIEELKDNRYFENIKSFKYLKNGSYRALMRFLDADNYQVCIYGHSCGLSDRIMLNEIFEHENCKSIKIFFYENELGENDFTNKTMEISRHFNSNTLMRKKIVEFSSKNKIPQIKK